MLSRGMSDASARLRRAKSSSSIGPRPIIDPASNHASSVIEHQHAVTAAEVAFERAKERFFAKKDSNLQDAESAKDAHQLTRRQSIRFTGPSAVPTRSHSITRRQASRFEHERDVGHETELFEIHPDGNRHARASSEVATPGGKDKSSAEGEFIEDIIASQPSSYRKLRNARSMYNPGKGPSASLLAGMPRSKSHFQRHSLQSTETSDDLQEVPNLHLRHSLSFLRGVKDKIPTSSQRYVAHDAAIQLARDQYLRQLEQQRLKQQQPSFFNVNKHQRSEKAFRRTVRTSSTNTYGSAIASPTTHQSSIKPKGFGKKARSISRTLTTTIKRVFRRQTGSEEAVPAQQLAASRAHYGDVGTGKPASIPLASAPDIVLIRQALAQDQILQEDLTANDGDSQTRSDRSTPSESDLNERSRVTSWTNSTAANTVHMPQLVGRQRLSIIKEDGSPHQPSSSARHFGAMADGYAVFREPARPNNTGRPVESQRVFSALQKEIDKKNRGASVDTCDSDTESTSDVTVSEPVAKTLSRSSSLRRTHITSSGEDVQLRRMQGNKLGVLEVMDSSNVEDALTSKTHRACDQMLFDKAEQFTPQQIAELNEEQPPTQRPLREIRSAFFPGGMRIERSNTSPYRRAMRSSNEGDRPQRSDINTLDHSYHVSSMTGSDSIYSRTSGACTPASVENLTSAVSIDSRAQGGPAIVTKGGAGDRRHSQGSGRSGDTRRLSDGFSGEWKKHLAHELAASDDRGPKSNVAYKGFPAKESGHKREGAQFDGDKTTTGHYSKIVSPVLKQPLGIIQSNSRNHPISSLRTFQGEADRSTFPNRTSLNMTRDASLQKENTPSTYPPANVTNPGREVNMYSHGAFLDSDRPKVSQNSPFIRKENVHEDPNTVGRSSLERMVRMRRLQSKSSSSLCNAGGSPESGKRLSSQEKTQTVFGPPAGSHRYQSPSSSDTTPDVQTEKSRVAKSQGMIAGFLKGRRREMRISEESGGDPAFL